IFAVAETYGAPVYSYARDLLVQEVQRLGPGLATDRDAHFEFWQYLVREGSEGQALAPLHELGILGALFPEVGRLRARAQHSLYHVYTVDTHTVFALTRLMRLRAGALAEEEPELTRIARAQQRPLVLMLGLLFHDLGKGLGPDHSKRGGQRVRAYAQRVALGPAHGQSVEARRERLAEQLAPSPEAREFAAAVPERYLAIAGADDAARHLLLWSQARKTGFASELHRSKVGEAELTLVAQDRPGLLA